MVLAVTAAITLAFGVILGVGGIWLSSLGGSAYYLVIGLVLSAIGLSLWQKRAEALWIYAAIVAATLVWAVFEVGFDWWPLAARGGVVCLLGLWLLTPLVTRGLKWGAKPAIGRTRLVVIGPLAVALVASAGVAVAAMVFADPYDAAGVLPGPVANLPPTDLPAGDWPSFGRTIAGNRWSPLEAINTGNVGELEVAWTYHTGEVPGADSAATFEVTPLKVGDTIYLCSPNQVAIALDAATGAERWRHDPAVAEGVLANRQSCSGVAYYADATTTGACAARIFLPTADGRLLALDAATGTPCAGFGTDGTVDLWQSMPHRSEDAYLVSSPLLVAGGNVILGDSVATAEAGTLPSGVVRAYDVLTGRLVWNFDAGNPDSITPRRADQTFTDIGPNITSAMSADEALGFVYVPTGNAAPDQYGAARSTQAENLSSAMLALDLRTGRMMWSYQTVHHDLWDMGVAAQPVLVDITVRNVRVPIVVLPTKQGDVFMLDRRTGQPVVAVTEEQAPQEGIADGDFAAPTQPVSALSFAPAPLTEEDMWGLTMFDQLACRIWFQSLVYDGRYTPPSVQGTLQQPGNYGVFNWGGVAIDPVRQVMIGSPSYLAYRVRMTPVPQPEPVAAPEATPVEVAAATPAATPAPATPVPATPTPATPVAPTAVTPIAPPPGAPAAGAIGNPAANAPADNPGPRPATAAATPAATPAAAAATPAAGARPAAPAATPAAGARPATPAATAVAAAETPAAPPEPVGPLFTVDASPFISALGIPCQAPPWGYVSGVNLGTGRLAWQHVSGTVGGLSPLPLPFAMGVPTFGGPLATAGGLVFISGSLDGYIRAYDVTTGAELWRDALPAGGQATPMTYATDDGRQFVVVAAGGNADLGTTRGDEIVAYALPASFTGAAAPAANPEATAPPEPILAPTAAERLGTNPGPAPAVTTPAVTTPVAPAADAAPAAATPVDLAPAPAVVEPAPPAVALPTPATPAP